MMNTTADENRYAEGPTDNQRCVTDGNGDDASAGADADTDTKTVPCRYTDEPVETGIEGPGKGITESALLALLVENDLV